jgi:hypothetical protein
MSVHEDIIYISKEIFKKVGEVTKIDDKIRELYTKLMKEYDCFTQTEIVMTKYINSTKENGGYFKSHFERFRNNDTKKNAQSYTKHTSHKKGNNNYNHNTYMDTSEKHEKHERPARLMHLHIDESCSLSKIKRQLKGHLNIINKNNYNKLSKKILLLVNSSNVECVILCILENACHQVFYLSIFANLISDILRSHDEETMTISNTINSFISNFIDNHEFLLKEQKQQEDTKIILHSPDGKYIRFCKQQKHKSFATSKNLVVIHLILSGYSKTWTLDKYSKCLTEMICNVISSEFDIDMILSLLKSIKEKNKDIIIDFIPLSNILTLNNNHQRWKFIVEDLFANV